MTTTITIDRAVVEQALEALENFARFQRMMMDGPDVSDRLLAEDYAEAGFMKMATAIPALRTALAEPDVDPCIDGSCDCCWTDKESQNKAEQPAEQEPVAWKHDCAALLTNDVELWIDDCPHCGKPRTAPQSTKQIQEPSAGGLLFAVEETIRNGDCPWQIEQAFDEYEAERKAAIGIRGDV